MNGRWSTAKNVKIGESVERFTTDKLDMLKMDFNGFIQIKFVLQYIKILIFS